MTDKESTGETNGNRVLVQRYISKKEAESLSMSNDVRRTWWVPPVIIALCCAISVMLTIVTGLSAVPAYVMGAAVVASLTFYYVVLHRRSKRFWVELQDKEQPVDLDNLFDLV